ncbi:lactoylglutathione lyase-like lyase [Actinobacteria bacterium IMCC26207]|nr:lactoylglutathione lyase-like lyase [Actinobacteria bacterium IMCC26207]
MSDSQVGPAVQVTGLDHIVLRVADAEASMAWYMQKLGLAPERIEQWRGGEVPFPSVRVDATTLIDLLEVKAGSGPAGINLDHFALLVPGADLNALAESGEFTVIRGPRSLWGAQGRGLAMYVADPDGHVVELRTYPAATAS